MQRLEVTSAVRPIYGSLGVKRLMQVVLVIATVFWGVRLLLFFYRYKDATSVQTDGINTIRYRLYVTLIGHALNSVDYVRHWTTTDQGRSEGAAIGAAAPGGGMKAAAVGSKMNTL